MADSRGPDIPLLQVIRENAPDCPFVIGTSNNVPLPSAYVPIPADIAENVAAQSQEVRTAGIALAVRTAALAVKRLGGRAGTVQGAEAEGGGRRRWG